MAVKKQNVVAQATLADVARGYLAWLEAEGAGPGTLDSYGLELKIALRQMGETTLLADLTPNSVQEFFDSAPVTRTRSNKPKARSSIDKTRRVWRMALLWAQDEKLVEVAPLPQAIAHPAVVAVPEAR